MRRRIAAEVQEIKAEKNMVPGLAVVLVGEDPASQVYVANKARQTDEVGHESLGASACRRRPRRPSCWRWSSSSTPIPQVHGILVQLPLPKQIDSDKVLEAIDPAKDVDGFHVDQCRPAADRPGRRWCPARRSAA